LATSLGTLALKFTTDTSGVDTGVNSIKSKLGGIRDAFSSSNFASTVRSLGSIASGLLAITGVSVGARAAITGIGNSMALVDRQAKLADRLGLSVGMVQKLAMAADLAGTDVELLASSILKMVQRTGGAGGGMPLDKRLFLVANQIARIPDPATRAARAFEVFGKGGAELINLLSQGGPGIMASAEAIDRFGLAISRVDAAKIEDANDRITEMKAVTAGLRNEIAVNLAPQISDFIDTWIDGMDVLLRRHEQLREAMRDTGDDGRRWYDKFIVMFDPGVWGRPGKASQELEGLAQMRRDADRNRRNALRGMEGLSGTLPAYARPGTLKNPKGTEGGKFAPALERGSMDAARAMQNAGAFEPIWKVAENTKNSAERLKEIRDALRAGRTPAQIRAELAGKNVLRPSRIRGGGVP
jgi:hypothetical protein